jgi:uncharacterized Zn finger protein (UPF0148 family)
MVMTEVPLAMLCPYCGLLFFAQPWRVFHRCPDCEHRFKVAEEQLLEACLEVE